MANQEHPLKLFNSLTREVEQFVPQDSSRVTMYNCGPTVYSYAHIGNARAAVVADVLFRVLRHIYGEDAVVYARNLTDVDDRIIAAATEQGVPISAITEKFAKVYQDDLAALNCLPPTHEPKATEHIGGMIALIETLLKDGFAYESEGHVFFDVSKYDDYGKLSGNTLEGLRGGDRVGEGEVARKRNAADFVLWKPELNGVGWDAPFGRGRPGWHIECSAMAKAELGETIDIHCGGIDLKFPHHENEIAQSNCAHGKPMARFWVHNEFLQMGKDKMSKSLGNVVLVHDLLKEWDGEVIRNALQKADHVNELAWSSNLIFESSNQLETVYRRLKKIGYIRSCVRPVHLGNLLQASNGSGYLVGFLNNLSCSSAMRAIEAITFRLARDEVPFESSTSRRAVSSPSDEQVTYWFSVVAFFSDLLGLFQRDPDKWFRGNPSEDDSAKFDALAAGRSAARATKNWTEADRIRDEGAALGIVFEDGPEGTVWRKA